MSNESQRYVAYTVEDRQWDARFNVQRDEDLEELVASIKRHWESGALRYILVGGPEIGTRPLQDDYQIRHVHVAAVFHNRISKRSILQHWGVKVRCFCCTFITLCLTHFVCRLETVIILFRGTELCLCPDGEIIIQKHSPRLIPDSVFYMKWGHSLLTTHQLAKRSQKDRKRKRSEKSTKSSSTCED